jgi:hypothetical protein
MKGETVVHIVLCPSKAGDDKLDDLSICRSTQTTGRDLCRAHMAFINKPCW